MGALTGFKLKSGGFDSVFQQAAGWLEGQANGVAAAARASAPVESGEYRDSIHVEMTTATALGISFKTGSNNRPVAIVVADVPYALAVEADTGNLARALDAAG